MPWKYHPILAKMRRFARLRHKFRSSLRKRGWAKTLRLGWKKVRHRLGWVSSDDYQNWIEENRPRSNDLARQRRWAKNTEGLPRILLLITTAGCSQEDIGRTERSLRRQTYALWS